MGITTRVKLLISYLKVQNKRLERLIIDFLNSLELGVTTNKQFLAKFGDMKMNHSYTNRIGIMNVTRYTTDELTFIFEGFIRNSFTPAPISTLRTLSEQCNSGFMIRDKHGRERRYY